MFGRCTAGLPVPCELGFYNPTLNANNQSACLKCPPHSTTLRKNSTAKHACVCDQLYYRTDHMSDEGWCDRCPVGTSCYRPGSTLRTLFVRPGYYRPSSTSIDVRICADASAGCGDDSVCEDSTSGCAGGNDPIAGCQPGLEGIFCSVCANASDPVRYYVAASDSNPAGCDECQDMTTLLAVGATASIIGMLILANAVASAYRRLAPARRAALYEMWLSYSLTPKLKQAVGFYQIATKIGKQYRVTMPAEVSAALNVFELAISFGLDITTPFECFGADRYEQRLLFWMCLPLVMVALLFAIEKLLQLWNVNFGALNRIFQLMFLLYTIVNQKAFEAFNCHDFGKDGRWLVVDVRVQCDTAEHVRIQTWAWIAIGLYPIAWTATIAVLLFNARKPIMHREKSAKDREHAVPTVLSKALLFVYSDYEPHLFFWELFEMFRRFLLVGLLSVYQPGSIMQITMAGLFCLLYLVIQVQAQPFKQLGDNFVALSVSFSLAILFFCCIIIQLKVLTKTQEVEDVLSLALQELFDIPAVLLSSIMLAGVFVTLVACAVVTFAQSVKRNLLHIDKTSGLYNKARFLQARAAIQARELQQLQSRVGKLYKLVHTPSSRQFANTRRNLFLSIDIQGFKVSPRRVLSTLRLHCTRRPAPTERCGSTRVPLL